MYYLLLPSLAVRQRMIDYLKAQGILSVFHYLPLHVSGMGKKFGGTPGDCPVAEDLSNRLLRLPFFNRITDEEQTRVIHAVKEFRCEGSLLRLEAAVRGDEQPSEALPLVDLPVKTAIYK
jgi:dTDP-4-amino-4,6-dideoxygalactose transaminase